MEGSVKGKTIRGLFWSGVDKFSLEIIQFTIGVILARLLMPSDYGLIGILMVFISFSTIFIDGGLTKALIQKANRTDDDFNTAFLYNLGTSVVLYIFLFIVAPYIAEWFGKSELKWLLRVLTVNFIISAFASVQNVRLTIAVDFKKISIISIVSGLTSGLFSVIFAYNGWGVWSLVFQQLINNLCKTVMLNVWSTWLPRLQFSIDSFKDLFGFGYKLILTNILANVYSNLYPIIIGKLYPMKTLGFYTRGQHYAALPINVIKTMFMNVSFPVLCSIKKDNERLRGIYSLYIEMSSFIVFPVMFLLIVVSDPLVKMMLTEKWLDAVPFMQILSLGYMFDHINAINLNLLFVKGRSDLALKLEVLKKSIALIILISCAFGGIWAICIGQAFYNLFATFLNSIYTKKIINLTYIDQAKQFLGVWLVALFACPIPYMLQAYLGSDFMKIFISFISYAVTYLLLHYLLQTHSGKYFYAIIKDYYNKYYK